MSDFHPKKVEVFTAADDEAAIRLVPIEHTLLSTNDAMEWSREFCRIFAGAIIVQDAEVNPNYTDRMVDESTMVAWFASAMQTALTSYLEARMVPSEPE